MNEIVKQAMEEIESLQKNVPEGKHIITGDKGYGWMLKCLSEVDADSVKKYLIANHERMPRVAYRYALERFDKATRAELMNL